MRSFRTHRIAPVLLAGALTFGAAACGGDDTEAEVESEGSEMMSEGSDMMSEGMSESSDMMSEGSDMMSEGMSEMDSES